MHVTYLLTYTAELLLLLLLLLISVYQDNFFSELLQVRPGFCCCCCDSPAALLLSSVVQVEEVCDCSWVVPHVLHCKLCRMALTVEQMLYGVWCHSTLGFSKSKLLATATLRMPFLASLQGTIASFHRCCKNFIYTDTL